MECCREERCFTTRSITVGDNYRIVMCYNRIARQEVKGS